MRIDFHPEAILELTVSTDWYAARSMRAAQDFAIEVAKALDKIQDNPERFARISLKLRACSVTRFPY